MENLEELGPRHWITISFREKLGNGSEGREAFIWPVLKGPQLTLSLSPHERTSCHPQAPGREVIHWLPYRLRWNLSNLNPGSFIVN